MADRSWSIAWNEKAGQFFVRFRRLLARAGEGRWGTKRVPKLFQRHQGLDAERWFIAWYAEYQRTGGLNAAASDVRPAKKTLRLCGPKWLQHRYDDPGTKPNTHKGFKESLHNWILDNARFAHEPIDDLDMECEFTAEAVVGWMNSLRGKSSSRLVHILCLKTIFEDCIALGWLDPDMANPVDRPAVRKVVARLAKNAKQDRVITVLAPEQVEALLTVPTRKVHAFRRMRYLLALATGLRDHELQGLVWSDCHLDAEVPFVEVDRQLDKIGCKPFVRYEDLVGRGKGKDEILTVPNAIVSLPKRGSRRHVPLLPVVIAALRDWKASWKVHVGRRPAPDDPVFPSGRGNRHNPPGQFVFVESPELLRKDLARVGQSATCQGIALDFHALRRTFATLLNANGVSEAEVGDLLGHGAKSTARGHYISSGQLGRRLELLGRLALPQTVQFHGRLVEAAVPNGVSPSAIGVESNPPVRPERKP